MGFHAVRLNAAALLAGMIAGATAGARSRLLMFAVRLMNPSYNGMVTHANATGDYVMLRDVFQVFR